MCRINNRKPVCMSILDDYAVPNTAHSTSCGTLINKSLCTAFLRSTKNRFCDGWTFFRFTSLFFLVRMKGEQNCKKNTATSKSDKKRNWQEQEYEDGITFTRFTMIIINNRAEWMLWMFDIHAASLDVDWRNFHRWIDLKDKSRFKFSKWYGRFMHNKSQW